MKVAYLSIARLAVLYIVAWCISPPLGYGIQHRLIALVAIGGLIFLDLKMNGLKLMKFHVAIIALIMYMLLASKIAGDSIEMRIGVYIMLCILLAAEILWNKNIDIRKFYFVILAVFLFGLLWNICTIQGILEVPNIMRLLVKNSSVSVYYAKRGVGGYGYLYTIIMLLPIGINCALGKHYKRIYRVCAVAFVVSSYIMIFQSQYFMALILAIAILAVYFIMILKNRILKIIALISVLTIFLWLYINAEIILIRLKELIDIPIIQMKIESMYDMLVNDGSIQSSEFSERYERYLESLTYALEHPVFGGLAYKITGNHSHILDFFAQFGIFIGAAYMYVIFKPLKRVEMTRNPVMFSVLFAFMIVAMMNTVPYACAVVLYMILPIYYNYYKEAENCG